MSLAPSPDASGAAVENAVVTFTPAAGVSAPIRFSWPYQVAQQNLQFDPYILIVPVGATVRFPNLDRVRHQRCLAQLEEGHVAPTELSARLGFAEASSFYRAFQRWTGRSFATFREERERAAQ